ncbi:MULTISPECIES: hypothetical protein [Pseudoalteromonas]|uniref:Uncharacterized protein n=1 Tax=Pseudoalteromonas agarivorans DSM 14585 TaxID=1312369 RepID=A0ACA8E1Z1_9GAMM|nr:MULTISPECIES: hypothetical protein [Pseudoalteromonas]ATC84315.1 hypothetical protein PAGA_b0391 [Pseudoalteromonas agarivorans DSM 14585]MDC9501660.1 hypothetical protein [Pseudoalteromonas sp. Angola-18]MDC9514178.1 hypothetical protein [Pseudoalteromonas sp. CST1]MDC9538600.1 hypothetical protein [Pseudoalteromonas sp. CST3]MDC9542711.1 hypothetical protein [Pseudoalteromonas sp. CST2]
METFKASVQYNDLLGTAAADKADMEHASKWLEEKGHISEDEYVLGISMWAGENHGAHRDPVSVKFVVSGLNGYSNIPEMIEATKHDLNVKEIRVEMTVAEFFALFKRFEVTLSNKGLLEGTTYSTTE